MLLDLLQGLPRIYVVIILGLFAWSVAIAEAPKRIRVIIFALVFVALAFVVLGLV